MKNTVGVWIDHRKAVIVWLAGNDGGWAAVRIDVIGVRIGCRRVPEIMHLQGIG